MQCLTFSEGSSMLEDFCIKALRMQIPLNEIKEGVTEFYRQCEEVGQANIERAQAYLDDLTTKTQSASYEVTCDCILPKGTQIIGYPTRFNNCPYIICDKVNGASVHRTIEVPVLFLRKV